MTPSLSQLLAAFDAERPLEQAETIPNSWYLDADLTELERRVVFGDTWQVVGRLDQVAEPGSYLTADVAGEPIVVVRDNDGILRAFFNVCRHRGAPLLTAPCGQATKMRCRYHGWTYDLTGRLRGTPEFDGVQGFRREDNGLVAVAVAVLGPLVCVHLGIKPTPLLDSMGPMAEAAATLGTMRVVERRNYEVGCNWKVFIDNFLDGGYHINTVHPALGGVLDYASYRNDLYDWCNVQRSPLKPPNDAEAARVATVRAGEAQYWWVFPNFMLNIYDGLADTNYVLPLGPDRCRVIFDFYFSPDRDQTFQSESIAVTHRVQVEDQEISEEVQRGLRSRSFTTGRFSVKREAPGYQFHQLLARKLRAT